MSKQLSEIGAYKLAEHLIKIINDDNFDFIDIPMVEIIGNSSVVSTSTFIEKINFDLTYMPLKHIGFKAITIAVTDILSKYAVPQTILLEMSFTNQFTIEHCEEIAKGMAIACRQNNVKTASLKITPSIGGMAIFTTSVGMIDKQYVGINTANVNDIICTTGDLGGAYAGLLLLEREKSEFIVNPQMQPDLKGNDYVLQRYIRPDAPTKDMDIIKKTGIIPTSMIANVAGLSASTIQICKASKKGCMLFEDKIPIDAATESTLNSFGIHPVTGALNGGDDYEILFTVKQEDYDKIKEIKSIHAIGYITEDMSMFFVPVNGQMIPLKAQGLN